MWETIPAAHKKATFSPHSLFHLVGYHCTQYIRSILTPYHAENPYIKAVSPNQLVVTRGEPVTLVFLIAADSNGATWNNEAARFSFTDRSGLEYSIDSRFQDSRPEFPQYFIYTIPSVDLSHAGLYTASAPSMQ